MTVYLFFNATAATETIAIERALWLLINKDFPGKDAALEDAARAVLGRLQQQPVRVRKPTESGANGQ